MKAPKFKVGDTVVPHIPKDTIPYRNGYAWIPKMDVYAEKSAKIVQVVKESGADRWIYKLENVCLRNGIYYKFYDFWLTDVEVAQINISEDDLSSLLEEGMS